MTSSRSSSSQRPLAVPGGLRICEAQSSWSNPRLARWAVAVLLLVSLGSAAHAEDEDGGPRAVVRSRLLDAYRANESIHYALQRQRHAGETDGSDWVFEAFVEGAVGGVRGFRGQEEAILVATDGHIIATVSPAQETLVADGVLALREARAPYYALRKTWRGRWDCPRIEDTEWSLCLDFQLGPKMFVIGLFASTQSVPGWLTDGFLADKRLSLDEAVGVVHVQGAGCRGTIRLSDGLPVTWIRLDKQGCDGATLGETAPIWTAEQWRATIHEACEQASREQGTSRHVRFSHPLVTLVATALICGDDLLRFDESTGGPVGEAKTVIEEIASVEVSSDPPDDGESAAFYAGVRRGIVEKAVGQAQEHRVWPLAKKQAFTDAIVEALRRHAAAAIQAREGEGGK